MLFRIITLLVLSFVANFMFAPNPSICQDGYSSNRISKDVEYRKYSLSVGSNKCLIHMILADKAGIKAGRISVEPVAGGSISGQSATPESIGKRSHSLAVINGPYYASSGNRKFPIGFMVNNGRLIQVGNFSRPIVGIDAMGEMKIQVAQPQAFVTIDSSFEPVFIWGVNMPPKDDGVVLYDRGWGTNVLLKNALGVAIKPYESDSAINIVMGPKGLKPTNWDGEISARAASGTLDIPKDGWVLVFYGKCAAFAEKYVVGAKVMFYLYDLSLKWERMRWIITLGTWFINEGRIRDYSEETPYSGNVNGKAHRSIIGQTWNDEIFFAVTTGSPLTISETADALLQCNVREAIMCDSGSSSGMWISGIGSIRGKQPVPMAFHVKELDGPDTDIRPLKIWEGKIKRKNFLPGN